MAGLVLAALWWYATKDHRLSEPDLTEGNVHYRIIRLVSGSGVFLISIIIAVFNTYVAELSWIFVGILLWWINKWFYRKELLVPDQVE
jgi:uncharacterized membrane protein YbhN (UPF0104 family)